MMSFVADRFNQLKFKNKFLVITLANIIVVLAAFSFVVDDYFKKRISQNQEENNLSLARNMARESVDPLLIHDYLQLDVLVQSTKEALLCKYAYILDHHGRVVAHSDKSRLGQKYSPPSTEEQYIRDRKVAGVMYQDYFLPIRVRGELLGYAVVGIDRNKETAVIQQSLHGLRLRLLIVAVSLFAFTALTASYLASRLTRRIGDLKQSMRQVQQGDLNVQLPLPRASSCKDLWDCPLKECPGYGSDACWAQGQSFLQPQKNCLECLVYKRACGDEIGELHIAFNQMVRDLKRNLDKLHQADMEKNRLERLSLLGQMAAQVAHEIKNPLNSIKGSAHYLKANFEGRILHEFLHVIEEESERLSDILTDFLNFSKPGVPHFEREDLNALVRDTLRLASRDTQDSVVRLDSTLDPQLPPFWFDYAKLRQSLLNLVLNAVHAVREGGTVQVSTIAQPDRGQLVIQDDGQGITAQELENIFKPFYTTKNRGNGLGLSIVEQYIRAHKGTIDVDSQPGQGTTFIITLPFDPR
jgi:signal transduction histidine kinase